MLALKKIIIVSLTILTGCSLNIGRSSNNNILKSNLPGFKTIPYFGEQQMRLSFNPEVSVLINAPGSFYLNKPTEVILFATPNGNTIEQTFGKKLEEGDDWHFNIQHIGAQTRFIRDLVKDRNIVTVYLQTEQKSWPWWRRLHEDNATIIHSIVDSVENIFKDYHPYLVLTGHSGGGSFTFGYLNSVKEIPDNVKRISFLDSDYGFEDKYGEQFVQWLKSDKEHYFSVLAYNDSVALYKGKTFVSPTGGTWYRTKMMQKYLADYFNFTRVEDSTMIRFSALSGRIKIFLKKNPDKAILHTVQVERNGFIECMLSGTGYENMGYVYYGERAYTRYIQNGDLPAD